MESNAVNQLHNIHGVLFDPIATVERISPLCQSREKSSILEI